MIKHVNGYEFSKKSENCKVFIRSFSRSRVRCMKYHMNGHMKPSMRGKLDHIILHIETNDLNSDRTLDPIAKSIIDITLTMKSNSQNVSISNIIMCNDNLNDKVMEVNGHLKRFCIEKNKNKLHLNQGHLKYFGLA